MYDDMGRENWTELWSTSSLKDRQGNDIGKDDKARQEVKKKPGRSENLLSHQIPRCQINCNDSYNTESKRN